MGLVKDHCQAAVLSIFEAKTVSRPENVDPFAWIDVSPIGNLATAELGSDGRGALSQARITWEVEQTNSVEIKCGDCCEANGQRQVDTRAFPVAPRRAGPCVE